MYFQSCFNINWWNNFNYFHHSYHCNYHYNIHIKTLDKKNDYQQLPNVDILQISKLNIPLHKLNKTILSSKKIINFNDENQTIPVNQETKTYLIIGNNSYNRQKIQITTKEENDKYEIKTNPEMISLRKGFACEFEISMKPFCSFEIEDEIMIVSVDIKKGTKDVIPIQMIIKTEESTRIDYDDIHIGKQIGKGSFGVVFSLFKTIQCGTTATGKLRLYPDYIGIVVPDLIVAVATRHKEGCKRHC